MITSSTAEDLCSWIAALPSSAPFPIVSSSCGRSILLASIRDTATAFTTFSIFLNSFQTSDTTKTLWVSDPIPTSANNHHLHLLLQLLLEAIKAAPSTPHSRQPKLNPARILLKLDSFPDTPVILFLALLCHLFWICSGEPPADASYLYFSAFDAAFEAAFNCRRSLRSFLLAVGADLEERFMRSVGYIVAKWCILRELSAPETRRFPICYGLSYAAEVHGLWMMKGYAPIPAMSSSGDRRASNPCTPSKVDPKEAAIRYALAHRQLEFVAQLEYVICGRDPRFLKVSVRVDNIRLHVARLAFGKIDNEHGIDMARVFASRVRVIVGPEEGAGYAVGPSLGRSTYNPELEVEATKTMKGGSRFEKDPPGAVVRAKAQWSVRAHRQSWRWEQDAEGSAAILDGVLCDPETGMEVAGGGATLGMSRRCNMVGRAFSTSGGLIISGGELPEVVSWRVGREMEGQSVRWRVGGRVWVSYLPNRAMGNYYETRWVEWEEEVEFTLVPEVGGCC